MTSIKKLIEYKCKEHYAMGYVAALKRQMMYSYPERALSHLAIELEHAEKMLEELRQSK